MGLCVCLLRWPVVFFGACLDFFPLKVHVKSDMMLWYLCFITSFLLSLLLKQQNISLSNFQTAPYQCSLLHPRQDGNKEEGREAEVQEKGVFCSFVCPPVITEELRATWHALGELFLSLLCGWERDGKTSMRVTADLLNSLIAKSILTCLGGT